MRLKQLELQGYKTFAVKTNFVFKGGLTAIVGPNGSGKSNIADAIQWVLGEQTYGRLRAKRSEDMIFSGSNERARLGMAQASLILDNADGWLPVDYGEVVITRRAYRSGENEYYLNGTRVRLRDISDLLSQSGLSKRTYTVIGQGLIDQALSLKPDERRALLEEAAGITGHQAKRDTALRELDETRQNLLRVQDILGEIEPRLRYLKVQAKRAEERMQVLADLDAQLRLWYGHRWHRGLQEMHVIRQNEEQARATVDARQETLLRVEEQDSALRQRYAVLRNQLGDWHRESSALHRQAEAAQREMAVGSERLHQLEARRSDLLAELGPLHDRLRGQQQQVQTAEGAAAGEQASLQELQARIQQAQSQLDVVEAERRRHQDQLAAAQRRQAQLQSEIAGQERRLVEQDSRKRSLAEEHERLGAELAAAQASQNELTPQAAGHEARIAEIERQGQTLTDRRKGLLDAIAQVEVEQSRRGEQLATLRRNADRLHDQLDLLQRLKDEGEGYSGGARTILRAARGDAAPPTLSGIVGAVADQLQVPPELELAIETALGGRLQDIIVERWEQAEQAIEWLKQTRGGRATFLPIDTLRVGSPARAPRGEPGVVGLASDLVKADRRLGKVVDYLLNRVIVIRDLGHARRILDASPERPTLVTLDGDIVRPGGSVSGGSETSRRDQGVLARERSLRELPSRLQQAREAMAAQEQRLVEGQRRLHEQRQELSAIDQEVATLVRQQQSETAGLAKLQGQAAQIAQQVKRSQERLAAAGSEQSTLAKTADQSRHRLAELAAEVERSRQASAEAETALASLETRGLTAELMERRTSASIVQSRLTSQQALLANQQRVLAQIQTELADKQQRAEALAGEHTALAARLDEMHLANVELNAEIERYGRLIDPSEAELAGLEAERATLAVEEAEHRKQLQLEEAGHSKTQLALQRVRDELEHLRHEIEHDVGLVELEQSDSIDDQPPLPLRPLVERLPVVEELPDGIEQEIRRLRVQYSRLGSVNPNAPEEYAAALERYEFLTSQSEDLRNAADTLEKVVAELDVVMKREFMVTYRAVAREFKERFTTLFGGGTAQLQLTDPEDPMGSGIDIIARPPGKRVQSLPLLSGGERSLTAAALILAILKVSPPPFCILDEVDAALDEANVDRFRAALREAARDTQFILITHNRGTIEAADTIYGISMGSDSVSQALSLHMEEFDGKRELVPDSA